MPSHLQVLMRVVARNGPLSDEEAAAVAYFAELGARAASNGHEKNGHGSREASRERGEVIRLLAAAGFTPTQIMQARAGDIGGLIAAQASGGAALGTEGIERVGAWASPDPNGPLVPRTRGGSKPVSLRQVLYVLKGAA